MKAFRLALALIRIPRLFATLLLFPLLLSFFIVYIQLIITGVFLSSAKQNSQDVKQSMGGKKDQSFVRKMLLKEDSPIGAPIVCRWIEVGGKEVPPPGPDCILSPYDVAIHAAVPATYDISSYVTLFEGNFRRIHVCKPRACMTDIVINVEKEEPATHLFSVWGAALLGMSNISNQQVEYRVKSLEESERIQSLMGKKFFYAAGFQKPASISDLRETFIVIANLAVLTIVALWLALKAHRKVLDYFSHSGALLPMVAAAGKGTFYGALWILTLTRVAFFLVASVPLCYYALREFIDKELLSLFFNGDVRAFLVWALAVGSSLTLATLIASIAELQHRHSILSFLYRYLPFAICIIGGLIWAFTFFVQTDLTEHIRAGISALPLVGIASILLAPIFTPQYGLMAFNAILTVAIIAVSLRYNARWFAAHLDEI